MKKIVLAIVCAALMSVQPAFAQKKSLVVGMAGLIAMVLFAAAGRPVFAVGAIAIAGFAIAVRRWLLQRMDAGLQARDAGAPLAVRQLRVLHLKSMLINAVQLAAVVASVPHIV